MCYFTICVQWLLNHCPLPLVSVQDPPSLVLKLKKEVFLIIGRDQTALPTLQGGKGQELSIPEVILTLIGQKYIYSLSSSLVVQVKLRVMLVTMIKS